MPGDLGVVLKTTPLRESDLLVTLYTESFGRVSAVARGARRSQRRFAGTLSLLVLGRYELGRQRGDLWSLESAEIVREWSQLASDVVGVAHASYVVELVGALLPPESPEPLVLELVVSMLESLAEGGPSPAALRAFELALLDVAGHRPALETCAACGDPVAGGGAVFDPTRGGAMCRRCAATSRNPGVRPLDPATIAYLAAIAAHDNPGEARVLDSDPRFTSAERGAGRDALVTMIGLLVGRPLKSLEYLAKLGAAARRHDP